MILVNGAAAESVSATDRGLAYGDGVFRTLLVRQGRARHWQRQYRKLERDCAALALACPAAGVLEKEILRAADDAPEAVGKIIVTRGSGARGYAPAGAQSPTRIVMVSAMPQHPPAFAREGVAVRVCETRYSVQPRLAGIKHLNRLDNVLARAEWNDPEVAEGLMLDPDGQVVGGTMTNLFIVENGALVTPALSRCGVAGAMRERIMQSARTAGIACREEPVSLARLQACGEAMLVNSVIGAWQVRSCGTASWKAGDSIRRVREWLDDEGD
jgi:4-amino-4-deoxychorismate lyase